MRSDVPNFPERVPALPIEARAATLPDDPVAAGLRGFGPLGLLAILVIVLTSFIKPLSAILVLLWAWRSHTPWREIGYVRPRSWIGTLAAGIVFGCAFKLLMKAIVMPLLGAPEINTAYHFVVGNRAVLPGLVFTMIVGAASERRPSSEDTCSNVSASFSEVGPAQKCPSSCSPPCCLLWAITPIWGFRASNRR